MAEGISHRLNFPNDHFTHDTQVEWYYFFGKIDKEFFTLATFRFKLGGFRNRATQWSIHNKETKYYEELSDDFDYLKNGVAYIPKGNHFAINCDQFFLEMWPNTKTMIHEATVDRNYYSIPSLLAEGMWYPDIDIKSDVWMDHEFTDYKEFSDWDWVGVKLDCGLYIMVHNSETDKRCVIQFNDKVIKSDFILENKHLFIHSLGMYLTLEPMVREKIFEPKFGISYSEQPFEVISKGGVIGFGMRERTYKEKENA